ncbi:MAG: hypothetical protein CVU48_01825 [Candidatus Cloacimonetes bacterium HGW-Cloacimonetes-1]|jgi:hypothetical protein|nr:MAG: hypothetical protein CVU48_01825 [Candidatus Cloacimonetes bacterium HGW-Cloacimonetes-1]
MSKHMGPCGIDCAKCDAFISTQTGDLVLKQVLAENYKASFKKEIALEDLDCDGCMADGRKIGFCAECTIRACADGKGYRTCAECGEFPCETGSFIWTAESKSKALLEDIRDQLKK